MGSRKSGDGQPAGPPSHIHVQRAAPGHLGVGTWRVPTQTHSASPGPCCEVTAHPACFLLDMDGSRRAAQAHGQHGTGSHSQQTCRSRVGFQSLGRENEGRKQSLACGSTKVEIRGGIREVEEPGRMGLRVRVARSPSSSQAPANHGSALSRNRPITGWPAGFPARLRGSPEGLHEILPKALVAALGNGPCGTGG